VLKVEDTVKIINCPPVSARKRFALHRIVESPELKRESTRNGRDYLEELKKLNGFYKGQESRRRNDKVARLKEELAKEKEEQIKEERRRGEEKKALREKKPFMQSAETRTPPSTA
jgi:hypothetical protein